MAEIFKSPIVHKRRANNTKYNVWNSVTARALGWNSEIEFCGLNTEEERLVHATGYGILTEQWPGRKGQFQMTDLQISYKNNILWRK
jgi:hypothetical protein